MSAHRAFTFLYNSTRNIPAKEEKILHLRGLYRGGQLLLQGRPILFNLGASSVDLSMVVQRNRYGAQGSLNRAIVSRVRSFEKA
jgi:hypothetical protein